MESSVVDVERTRAIGLGGIEFPSGVVVACDPFYVTNPTMSIPFKRRIKSGVYSILLILGEVRGRGERNLLTYLNLSQEPVVQWEVAELAETDSFFGNRYGVDSGIGSFMDHLTAQQFARTLKDFELTHPDKEYFNDVILKGKDPQGVQSFIIPAAPNSNLHLALFDSGLGDGLYTSYWGLDTQGEPALLVTDFGYDLLNANDSNK